LKVFENLSEYTCMFPECWDFSLQNSKGVPLLFCRKWMKMFFENPRGDPDFLKKIQKNFPKNQRGYLEGGGGT